MTAYGSSQHASPLAPLVDETRLGSAGGQAMVGITGIVLAVILVMGQISLATSKGIAMHLHNSVQHVTSGNQTMESVIERAAPSVQMETALAAQAKTLAHTKDAMVQTNAQMAGIAKTTKQLDGVVGRMQATSATLASGVGAMDKQTGRITSMLGTLPGATERTHSQLSKINSDTNAINTELGAIGGKMEKYGLPHALCAPTGGAPAKGCS
ncbi:MAG: hypothetical protein JWM98_3141 [Thermoleophilia bacterium]|nr:hypothetical protein [Thermoleophilia bacterium]